MSFIDMQAFNEAWENRDTALIINRDIALEAVMRVYEIRRTEGRKTHESYRFSLMDLGISDLFGCKDYCTVIGSYFAIRKRELRKRRGIKKKSELPKNGVVLITAHRAVIQYPSFIPLRFRAKRTKGELHWKDVACLTEERVPSSVYARAHRQAMSAMNKTRRHSLN